MRAPFNDCLVPTANSNSTQLSMLKSSFFLPTDLITKARADGWIINKIQVVENEEFWKTVPLLRRQATNFLMLPDTNLLKSAKLIGVSIRTHEESKQVLIVAKLWIASEGQE
jgi:hypothetical protein